MTTPKQEHRIAILKEEMDFIHTANQKYWTSAEGRQSREARAEYERRLKRLDQIRVELSELQRTPPESGGGAG
jgi:hypothetical protein